MKRKEKENKIHNTVPAVLSKINVFTALNVLVIFLLSTKVKHGYSFLKIMLPVVNARHKSHI